MRQVHTAVLERFGTFSGDFATEPYEAGWAEEAIFFIRVDAVEGATPALTGKVQISPMASRGSTRATLPAVTHPGVALPRAFGNWLRLACRAPAGRRGSAG